MKRKRNANSNAQINRTLKYRRFGCPFMNIYALFYAYCDSPEERLNACNMILNSVYLFYRCRSGVPRNTGSAHCEPLTIHSGIYSGTIHSVDYWNSMP